MQRLLLLTCLLLVLAACQRDNSFLGRVTDSGLLVKQVDKVGNDSTVTVFIYNPDNQLIEERSVSNVTNGSGVVETKSFFARYIRNEAGNITEIISNGFLGDLSTSIDTTFHVQYTTQGQVRMIDSTIEYIYNIAGQVIKTNYFNHAGDPEPAVFGTWAYSPSGNLTQVYFFKRENNGSYGFNIGYNFQYDTKVNPLYDDDKVLLPFKWGLAVSPNNVIQQTTIYPGPASSDQNTISYEYKSTGVPATAVFNSTAVQGTKYITYYYQ